MDKDTIEKLRPHCTDTEWAEMSTKYNAYVRWLGAYQADGSRLNLAELDAAKKSLALTIREIEGRRDVAAAAAEPLANLLAAVGYLKNQGFKVGKSKLYNDAKAGLVKVNADGTVNESEAIAYAHRFLKKIKAREEDKDDFWREKAEAELEYNRTRNEKMRFEMDRERGLYLLKDDVRREIAVKLGVLEAGFKNMIRVQAEDMIYKTGGDTGKAKILVELMYEAVDRLLGEFGDMDEINVVIVKRKEPVSCQSN